jgi:signal transduction histidine kinase
LATSLIKAELMPLLVPAPQTRPRLPERPGYARWREAAVITVALWSFVLILYLPMIIDRHRGESWSSIALDSATVLFSMALAMPLFALFRKTADWPLQSRGVVLGAGVLGAAVLNTAFDLIYTGWIAQNIEAAWAALPTNLSRGYISAVNYACVFGTNVALFQLLQSRRYEASQARQLADARSAAQQAQLAALRFQLNPHFLFNTLNAISAMIVTRRNDEAEAMTDKLSSFLRASLGSDPMELVPLEQELSLIEDYLEIEAIRFGDRLEIDIDCSGDACDARVPSFLLQPLVENAIKYGVAPSRETVRISVTGRRAGNHLVVTVHDDGKAAGNAVKTGGAGVGLDNVRRRLRALYGDAATLTAGPVSPGYTATIRMPVTPPPDADRA